MECAFCLNKQGRVGCASAWCKVLATSYNGFDPIAESCSAYSDTVDDSNYPNQPATENGGEDGENQVVIRLILRANTWWLCCSYNLQ